MKNGFLIMVALLGFFYSQSINGATPVAHLAAPSKLTQQVFQSRAGSQGSTRFQSRAREEAVLPAGTRKEEILPAGSRKEAVLPAGSRKEAVLPAGAPEIHASLADEIRIDFVPASSTLTGRSTDGARGLRSVAVDGTDTTSTAESVKLLMAGSALILIGATLKKMQKKT